MRKLAKHDMLYQFILVVWMTVLENYVVPITIFFLSENTILKSTQHKYLVYTSMDRK